MTTIQHAAAPVPLTETMVADKLSGSEKVVLKRMVARGRCKDEDTFELRSLRAFGLVEPDHDEPSMLRASERGRAVDAQIQLSELDAACGLIMQAFNAGLQREMAEEDAVRSEIKAKGTYWAGQEIYRLRKALAARKAAS